MDSLITTFHIDWKLLIAQIVNFGIVLAVLWFFALKPLLKTMKERGEEIDESLKNAEKIKDNLTKAEKDKEAIILAAKKEAQLIIEESRKNGNEQGQQIVNNAKQEVQTVIATAKEQINREKEKILIEAKAEVGDLVIQATRKILEKTGSKELDEKIVENTLRELK
jgi:F-type H+-transporting ATPase subunit b